MITLQQAIELAIEAHKGQWRKPRSANANEVYSKTLTFDSLDTVMLENGNKLVRIWDSEEPNFIRYVIKEPYITHPLAVMNMMDTDEEKIVAVLHDIIEDTEAELCSDHKSKYWISFNGSTYLILHRIWASLYVLTKLNDDWTKFKEKGCYQSYAGYINDISLNKTATKVKIADIVHNLSCSPSDHAKQKYLKAIPVLLKSL